MVTTTTFVRLPEVKRRTAKSRSSIYQGMDAGTFPKQVKIGPRAVAWIDSEIEQHIQECIAASRPGDTQ